MRFYKSKKTLSPILAVLFWCLWWRSLHVNLNGGLPTRRIEPRLVAAVRLSSPMWERRAKGCSVGTGHALSGVLKYVYNRCIRNDTEGTKPSVKINVRTLVRTDCR